MNLVTMFYETTQRYGSRPVFIEKGSAVTYEEFAAQVEQKARLFIREGICPGDRALVLVPLGIDLYACVIALWSVGACAVVLDPSAGRRHIEKCLQRVRVSHVLGVPASLLFCRTVGALRKIPGKINICRTAAAGGPACEARSGDEQAPALISFTSGSTGLPKAIVRTHEFLLDQYQALLHVMEYKCGDVDLMTLPVFTFMNIATGVTTVIPDDKLSDIAKVNAGRLAGQIVGHRVTRMTLSPELARSLASYALRGQTRYGSITSLNVGGGPVYPDLLDEVVRAFPPESVKLIYGSTEAEPIAEISYSALSSADLRAMEEGRGLIAGFTTPDVRVRLLDGKQNDCACGEIAVAGKHVVQGYLDGAGDDDTKLRRDGVVWHRTGDMGRFDEKGRLWLLGRACAVIQNGKEPLFPFCIESMLRCRYHVKSALVPFEGQTVLFVETRKEIPGLKEALEAVDHILYVRKLPMDTRHRSKADYGALRKKAQQALRPSRSNGGWK